MPEITLLSQETIDKIAAGEVVERPSSVVKELVENAIDAKATAVTVEIKEGGISFIRITDNGCGIERAQVPLAFLRHSTSKIKSVEDLMSITSLGFRGEALSSIAAVSQVELITKTYGELTGTRYVIEGSKEKENEEIGAPEGTTFIVRNLFYNTPARRKFLKTAQTEGNYINDLMERLALSHPGVSFKFINNGQTKMHTSGNSREKDMIYHIYGRDITSGLLEIDHKNEYFHVKGFIGKPLISRGNRNFENYFINGRYIKSALLSKSIEEAYKGFLMQHQYPFCVLYFSMDTDLLDVNVHPTKMELRFSNNEAIYKTLFEIIRGALTHKDFIPEVPVQEEKIRKRENIKAPLPEPFERRGVEMVRSGGRFQPQDIQQGTGGQSGFAASKENEDVQTTIPMQSAAPQKESAPPENLSVFNSLLPKKETAVTEQSGTFQGEMISDLGLDTVDLNGNGKIDYVMVEGDPENVDAQYRTEYSVKALEDAGLEVNCLSDQVGNWQQDQAQQIVANALGQYGNDVEVVFCNNDAMALGALQAIQSAGRTVGTDIYLVGVDALSEALEDVLAGTMTGTVFNDHFSQSHSAADAAINYITGAGNDHYIGCDYVKVTKDNAQDVLDMVK